MTYSLEELKELIPLYLNNRLSEKERRAFEDGLNQYPELKVEFKEFSEIQKIYKEIEKDVPMPSNALYQRVLKNIQPQIKFSLVPAKKSYLGQIQDFLKRVFNFSAVVLGDCSSSTCDHLASLNYSSQGGWVQDINLQRTHTSRGD